MADVVFILRDKRNIGCSKIVIQSFKSTINEVIIMLKNYNASLVNSTLSDWLFAIRFFEEGENNPAILADSRSYVKKYYPSFDLNKRTRCDEKFGLIGVIGSDMKELLRFSDSRVLIDLEEKQVSFINVCKEYTKEYWKEHAIRPISELNICPYDIEHVPFNELEDLYDFVYKNEFGWLSEADDNKIFLPFNQW